MSRFLRVPTIYVLSKNKENITIFYLKIIIFIAVENCCIYYIGVLSKCPPNSRQSKTLTLTDDKPDQRPQDRRQFAIVNDVFKYCYRVRCIAVTVFGLYLSKIKIAVFDCRISILCAKAQVSFDVGSDRNSEDTCTCACAIKERDFGG